MMKNILKRSTAFMLILAMLMICGCGTEQDVPTTEMTEAEEPIFQYSSVQSEFKEITKLNDGTPEIPFLYIKYKYNIRMGADVDSETGKRQNLSETAAVLLEENHVFGSKEITSLSAYTVFLEALEAAWTEKCSFDGMLMDEMEELHRSPELVIDEVFFRDYSLLVLDAYDSNSVQLVTRLYVVEDDAQRLVLGLRHGSIFAYTASNAGVLYLIAVPRSYDLKTEIIWHWDG